MFNGCRACRRRLAKRAEGNLPRSQWGRLEAHLSKCRACRRIDEADREMHMILSRALFATIPSRMAPEAADAFDDRVMNMLLNRPKTWLQIWLDDVHDRMLLAWRNIPTDFLTQVAGGALAAATVSAIFLTVALRVTGGPSVTSSVAPNSSVSMSSVGAGPISIEFLLDSPSPRAAMLWTRPGNRPADTQRSRSAKPASGTETRSRL